VSNGNNLNINYFNSITNPSLFCIEVDNVTWANTNWSSSIDNQSFFSDDCSTVGVIENSFSNIFIYPNPTNREFTIELGDITTGAKVTLTNNLGQVIIKRPFTMTSSIIIDIDGPEGIYFLKVEATSAEPKIFKIIKS
jgi:hypothetical protein